MAESEWAVAVAATVRQTIRAGQRSFRAMQGGIRRRAGYASEAAGLDLVLRRVKPLVCFFGHHHARVDAEVAGVRCIGLN